ncbi:MAG: SRPBCC family protein [Actinobacteria bacterium]|nr:MAG: SRPBCC family protein [Actinomycetota bacterium]
MKPVTVTVDVPNDREEVYAFLDVLANHEPFTDHMMVDWELSGPKAGVGATATAKVRTPGSNEIIEIKVIEADPPRRIVEESVSAGGKRRTRGIYTLEELPEGGTDISFELAWLEAPRNERMAAPLMRAFMRRANGRAMRRLAKVLRNR